MINQEDILKVSAMIRKATSLLTETKSEKQSRARDLHASKQSVYQAKIQV